jgi:hypothetical protein
MTIPFLSVRPKSIKLKVSPRFPAKLLGGAGIDVNKANGNYSIALDVGEFGQSLVLPANPFTLVFDPTAGSYSLVPPSVFSSAIPEAPPGPQTYGRLDAVWVPVVPISGATMTGLLILSGDPAVPLGSATKHYVDAGMRSYLTGLTLSTAGSSATFSVAAGNATDSTNVDMLVLGSPISKTTAAWVVGSGNGAWDGTSTNPASNAVWQHVYLIKRTDTGVVDVLISGSPSTPTVPSPYNEFRRIGSMKTTATGQWVQFTQVGDEFLWSTTIQDSAAVAIATTPRQAFTVSVPTGIKVLWKGLVYVISSSTNGTFAIAITSGDQVDYTPSTSGPFDLICITNANFNGFGEYTSDIRTNTSGQIFLRASATGVTAIVETRGWIDRRGRDT